jgi:hypothetical protein
MMRKKNGERGNPYLRPQDASKNLEGVPFIRFTKEAD